MLREYNRQLGLVVIVLGAVSLLGLRFWTSPLTRSATQEGPPGLFEFLLIPAFFIVVGVGVALVLWEPGEGSPE